MNRNGIISPEGRLNPATAGNMSASYEAVKEFEGRKYTGMRVGGGHSWYYRQGEWDEVKVAPDRWRFTYAVNKRRKRDAPEGSGAPVGTEYHWYILAHQNVRKLDANEYATSMTGTKYKLAHRRVANREWSVGGRDQLRQLIGIFEQNIIELRRELGEVPASRREVAYGRRTPLLGLPPTFMAGQPPLETYSTP